MQTDPATFPDTTGAQPFRAPAVQVLSNRTATAILIDGRTTEGAAAILGILGRLSGRSRYRGPAPTLEEMCAGAAKLDADIKALSEQQIRDIYLPYYGAMKADALAGKPTLNTLPQIETALARAAQGVHPLREAL